jgi:putative peptidoglycan lipid II flippase
VYQVNVMIDGFMAQALLTRGGPTTYYYANRIQQLPLALVATAATSAVFPALKALGHAGRTEELRRLHARTHLSIVFVALPATVGLFVLARPIVAVLLGHGEFGEEGIVRTADALRLLCLALLPAGAVGLVGRTYYAIGDFMTPVRVSTAMLGLNIALNLLFLLAFRLDVAGLALATAISAWGNLALLVPGLLGRWKGVAEPTGLRFGDSLLRMGIAAGLCGLAAWSGHRALAEDAHSVAALAVAILSGIVVYIAASTALGVPQWTEIRARIGRPWRAGDRGG